MTTYTNIVMFKGMIEKQSRNAVYIKLKNRETFSAYCFRRMVNYSGKHDIINTKLKTDWEVKRGEKKHKLFTVYLFP